MQGRQVYLCMSKATLLYIASSSHDYMRLCFKKVKMRWWCMAGMVTVAIGSCLRLLTCRECFNLLNSPLSLSLSTFYSTHTYKWSKK